VLIGRGNRDEDRSRYSGWVDLGLQTSLTLALSVLLLGWLGHWLDGLLGWDPWLTVAGALWGAAGGTIWVVLRVKQFADEREKAEKAEREMDDRNDQSGTGA
jgi:F0F1-type ATP synthase assembly protein I